jgi:hypothetical protein
MAVSSEHGYKHLDSRKAGKLLEIWVTMNFSTKALYLMIIKAEDKQKLIFADIYTHTIQQTN